jgi:hypothetical protein
MAYTTNADDLLLGTGRLEFAGNDLGYFEGATLSITREELEHLSGWPRRPDATVITAQSATFSANLHEFNWSNLEAALGVASSDGKITFGNLSAVTDATLELWIPKKDAQDGSLVIHLYKAQISQGFDISFSDTEWQGLPVSFKALADPSNSYALGYVLLTTTTCVA